MNNKQENENELNCNYCRVGSEKTYVHLSDCQYFQVRNQAQKDILNHSYPATQYGKERVIAPERALEVVCKTLKAERQRIVKEIEKHQDKFYITEKNGNEIYQGNMQCRSCFRTKHVLEPDFIINLVNNNL